MIRLTQTGYMLFGNETITILINPDNISAIEEFGDYRRVWTVRQGYNVTETLEEIERLINGR